MPSYFTYDLKTTVASYKDCLRLSEPGMEPSCCASDGDGKYVCR